MKKLFAVLIALGLIVAFSATASAVDVKFSGSYYLVGVYDDNPSLAENAYSRAYFYQRIRIMPVFEIAKGLTFTARMDAMEGAFQTANAGRGAGAFASRQDFDWERGWVTFKTGIGQFDVGYMSGGAWGTVWADSEGVRARIKYTGKFGPVLLIAIFEQNAEGNTVAAPHYADADGSAYYLAPIFLFKGGSAGLLYGYIAAHNVRPTMNAKMNKQILYPYMKATFGPVYVEAEINYIFGELDFEAAGAPDMDYRGWGAYLKAQMNMGPATFGALAGWSKGEDKGGDITLGPGKGADFNPALILFNDDLNTWSGGDMNTNAGGGANVNINDGYLIFNMFVDYKVTPKFSLGSAVTWAKADEAQIAGQDDDYGFELDVTTTYKIYDNLSYMVGAGYLWAGDWFKKGAATAVENDYILMNKLTLSF